ncbi:MAG: ABC transporter substrate-binding protein [Dorea sp.]
MKKKKVISLLLCLAMTCTMALTACSSSEKSTEEESSEEDLYTVKILAYGDGTEEAEKEISEAISEITREKIGVNVEITKGYTAEELNLMLTSGEPMDIFPAMSWEVNFATLVNQGLVSPITDLLDEYAPETKDAISDSDWACVTINGDIYGIPMNKEKASSSGLCVRTDVAEELNLDLASLKTFDDVEAMLTQVKEQTDYYPMGSDAGNLVNILPCDELGDKLGVLENVFDDDLTVVDWYETDSYRDLVYMMYDWN